MTDLLSLLGGFQRGSVPMWGTFVLALVAMVLRFTPLWRKMSMDANDKLIANLGVDSAALRAEMHSLKGQVEAVTAKCNASDVRVGQLEFALRVAMEELDRVTPDSSVVAHIRNYLAATSLQPSGMSQKQMDLLRAVQP